MAERRLPRRHFLRRVLTALAGGASLPALACAARLPAGEAARRDRRGFRLSYGDDDVAAERALPRRTLGGTGIELPVLGMGGHHLGMAGTEVAARALLDTALGEGVRFFDTAEQYQREHGSRSERWLGLGLEHVRRDVFLMTKTFAPETRSAASAREHLAASLERLRTDTLDLWQLHSVQSPQDVDRAFAAGGAMEALFEARESGVARFIGVTGHVHPAAHLRALEHWDAGLRFDVVQLPINPLDRHQLSFQLQVLPELERRGLGILAMKTVAGGALAARGLCSVPQCLRYVLGLPVDVLVSGMETPEQVVANARTVRQDGPLPPDEAAGLLDQLLPRVELGLEWYKSA